MISKTRFVPVCRGGAQPPAETPMRLREGLPPLPEPLPDICIRKTRLAQDKENILRPSIIVRGPDGEYGVALVVVLVVPGVVQMVIELVASHYCY